MDDRYCHDCKSFTPLVFDHRSGNTICSECGLVLRSHSVGESTIPLRTQSSNDFASSQWQNENGMRTENPLHHPFELIGDMADKLGLFERIKNHARVLYRKADAKKLCGRSQNPIAVMAASLYLACQEEGLPRTLKEIFTVTSGISMKELHKSIDCLKKQLDVGKTIIKAKDLAKRYCSNLRLSHHTIKAVQETAKKSEECDIRRKSMSILAAAIYMITRLSEEKMSLREIARATEVTEDTVRKTYKELYPYASCLIPSWYAKEEDIKKTLFIP